jgi:hypothetical protein
MPQSILVTGDPFRRCLKLGPCLKIKLETRHGLKGGNFCERAEDTPAFEIAWYCERNGCPSKSRSSEKARGRYKIPFSIAMYPYSTAGLLVVHASRLQRTQGQTSSNSGPHTPRVLKSNFPYAAVRARALIV